MSKLRWLFVFVVTLLAPGLISESCQAGFVVTSFAGSSFSANTSIRFRNDTGQDFLVFDRFAVFATQSQAVPEPGSLLIFGLGGLCVRFVRRSISSP